MIQKGNYKEIIIRLTLLKYIVITPITRSLHSFGVRNYKLHKLYSFLNQILKEDSYKLYYNLYFVHFLTPKTRKTLILYAINKLIGVSNVLESPYNLVPTMEAYNDF